MADGTRGDSRVGLWRNKSPAGHSLQQLIDFAREGHRSKRLVLGSVKVIPYRPGAIDKKNMREVDIHITGGLKLQVRHHYLPRIEENRP